MSFLGLFKDETRTRREVEMESQAHSYSMAEDAFLGMPEEMQAQFIESRAFSFRSIPAKRLHDVANQLSRRADQLEVGP